MVPIGSPETSVGNYHYSLRNNPEERSSHPLRGGNLESRIALLKPKISYNNIYIYLYGTDSGAMAQAVRRRPLIV
jgi:hypothetical protein